MPFASACVDSFDTATRSQGRVYFLSGKVRGLTVDSEYVQARVQGSSRAYFDVELERLDASGARVMATCTCSDYERGVLCKHAWALVLALDAHPKRWASKSDRIEVVHVHDADDAEPNGESWHDEDSPEQEIMKFLPPQMRSILGNSDRFGVIRDALAPLHGPQAKAPKKPAASWKKQFDSIAKANHEARYDSSLSKPASKSREIWYLVNVGPTLGKEKLAIEFFQREARKNGDGWCKFKRLAVKPESLQHLPTAEDRLLMSSLLGNEPDEWADQHYGYYGSGYQTYRGFNRSWIRPTMYEFILPRLAATGRLVWALDGTLPLEEAHPTAWDDGEPWQCRVRFETDAPKQTWRIVGELFRGNEVTALKQAVCILKDGLVLFPDRLARARIDGDMAWVTALRNGGPIEIPFADRGPLVQELCKLPQASHLELPAEVCATREVGVPIPRVEIASPPQQYSYRDPDLWVTVTFQYGDRSFAYEEKQQAVFDETTNRMLVRDRSRELELYERLKTVGFREPNHYYSRESADFTLSQKRLVEAVRALTLEGWVIETQGVKIRRPGDFKLDVTTTVDWFELNGSVDFDGVTASLPALLAAVRNNEQFVRLDDGTQGILPEEWLEKYGKLAQLAQPSGDTLRFTTSQGLLLDALLFEQEHVRVDQGFTAYREKLRDFAGIKPSKPVGSFVGELRNYQKDGLGWLHFLRDFKFGGCLADDMGLGKTVQVLALLEARRSRALSDGETRRPSMVVVPKSLIFNWQEEAARFAPQLRILNFTGIERGDRHAQTDDYDLLITTYGTLRRDVVKLKDVRFDYAILDESQAIKNGSSQAAKACRLIQSDHRLAMTGTPVENHLGELWSLFDFLNPGMLGRSSAFASFAKGSSEQDGASLRLLSRAVRPYLLRRTKDQVLSELPEKSEQTLYCELPPKERKAYDELREYYRAQLSGTVKTKGMAKSKIHVLEALLRLRQAACHPGLLDKKKTGELSAKLETLLEQVAEIAAEGHKALVFSQFTSLLDIVRKHLDERGLVYEYLDGKTNNRGERVKRFQEDPDCPLFLISLKAGGHGLNLTAADYVFILDPWWNPAVEAQAVDRAHRIGQTRRVFAYRLIAKGTVEDKILELQKTKKDLADAIVSTNNSVIRNLTAEDLELLLS